MSISDDDSLRPLLKSNPGRAMDILHARYFRPFVNMVMRYVGERSIAEDIVQEAFANLWLYHQQLAARHDKPIIAYLFKIVKNKTITYVGREQQRQEGQNVFASQVSTVTASVEREIIRDERGEQLRAMIARLTPRQRECLVLRLDEELSNSAISERLKITVKAVEAHITAALKQLRLLYRKARK